MKNLKTRFELDASSLGVAIKEIKGAVGEAINGFSEAGKSMAGLWDAASSAAGDVAEAVAVTERQVKAAARDIGFTLDETVEKQVARHRLALDTLKASGTLSAAELERATKATEEKISRLYAKIGKETKQLETPMAGLRRAIGNVGKSMNDARKAGQEFGQALRGVGSAAGTVLRNVAIAKGAVIAVGAAVTGLSKSAANAADAQIKASRAAGMGVEAYGRLKFAAEQAGLSSENFGAAVNKLNKSAFDAASGNKAAIEQFQRLGVQVTDTRGRLRSTEAILQDVSEVFRGMPDGLQKSALAAKLFGEEVGPRMISFLNNGKKGLKDLGDQAVALGVAFSESQGGLAENFNDTTDRLQRSIGGVKNSLGFVFMPALIEGANAITAFVSSNRKAITAFVALQWEKVVAVVKDVIAVAQGRDADVKNSWLIDLRDQVVGFATSAKQAVTGIIIPAFQAFMGIMDKAAGLINGVFGTNLTGQTLGITLAVAKVSGVFGLLAATLGTVGPAVNLLSATFKFLAAPMEVIGPIIKGVTSGFTMLAPILTAIAGGIKAIGVAILANPIGLLIAAVAVAAVAIVVYWDEIKAAGVAAWTGIKDAGGAAWDWLTGKASSFGQTMAAGWEASKAADAAAWEAIKANATAAWDYLRALPEQFLGFFSGIMDSMIAKVMEWTGLAALTPDQLAQAWETAKQTVLDAITSPFRAAGEVIESIWDGVLGMIQKAIDLAKKAAAAVGIGGGKASNDNLPRKATGGPIVGPGTGTSDSVLMWGSNGEFMQQARAVKAAGLGFMHALNRVGSRGEFVRLIQSLRLPGFATGGLIQAGGNVASRLAERLAPAPIPGLAMAGAVEPAGAALSRVPVNINLDGNTYTTYTTQPTADRLVAVRNSQGRRPRWSG